MSSGRVDIRHMKRTGRARMRFYNLSPDQVENIISALGIAREDGGWDQDSTALDAICMHFLATYTRRINHASVTEMDART